MDFEIGYRTETIHAHCTHEVTDPLSGLIGYGLQVGHKGRHPRTVVRPGEYTRTDINGGRQAKAFMAAVFAVDPQREGGATAFRSDERRVGTDDVSTGGDRGWAWH